MIKNTERIDELQRNGYRIIQDSDRFCFGMDAVLLSGFAMAKEGDRVLDLGTGTGIITGDIREADRYFQAASFDVITCNPPYMIGRHGLQ